MGNLLRQDRGLPPRPSVGAAARARALLAAAVLAAVPAGLRSAPEDARLEAVLARVEAAEKGIRSVSFEFDQTADISLTGERQVIRGAAYFQKPDRFRVEQRAPQAQTVVSDGKSLWLHNPGQKQVFVDGFENWAKSAGFPKGLLPFQQDVEGLREKYVISYEGAAKVGGAKTSILKLTPRASGPWPYSFRLWIDDEKGVPVRTELETRSVKSVTKVSRLKVNPVLDAALFAFDVPPGTQVLGSPGR